MQLRFSKMHGLGNDFVVIDAVRRSIALSDEQLRFLADRHCGVGCDQILLAEPPSRPEADFRYRIFNADGGEVEHCGNGVRCLGRFLVEQGLTSKRELVIEALAGDIRINLLDDGRVRVDMGAPRLAPSEIPFCADAQAELYPLEVGGRRVEVGVVSMGNPHAVMLVDDVDSAPVAELGPLIANHSRFPRRVNAGFMQIVDASHVRLRVFERGVGETLACGSGACAAVVAGQLQGRLRTPVTVDLPGGRLSIDWPGPDRPVLMTGPAVTVFEGVIGLS